ncbi:MAG TPA: thiamine pyrophosphate-dependent enzyme, partial [Steroidobacteraceae bacterium]|nr:thiamine pyrophosphate-dependent enzyme [Steroidobacteraceae bacterium]
VEALAECADEICSRLRSAKRPIIIVDVEVRRYRLEARVAQLARAFRVPVVTTFMGRGLMADAADVTLGTYLGGASSARVKRAVEGADAALLLGVIVSDTNFALSAHMLDPRTAMRAIDRGVRVGHHEYANIPLDALIDALLARAPRGKKGRKHWRVSEDKSLARSFRHRLKRDDNPIQPSDVATAVNELFAKHGPMPMTSDVGDCLFTAMEIEHSELAAPAYYAGMGFGVPAGMGIAAATGVRPLILVGDGAFQMTGFELGNCRRYGLDPIVLVFDNQSWEMLRAFQPESAFNNLDDWHFAAIASHLGGHGDRVHTRNELVRALDEAIARRGIFSLIEIMLPRGVTSDTLARFVRDFRKSR